MKKNLPEIGQSLRDCLVDPGTFPRHLQCVFIDPIENWKPFHWNSSRGNEVTGVIDFTELENRICVPRWAFCDGNEDKRRLSRVFCYFKISSNQIIITTSHVFSCITSVFLAIRVCYLCNIRIFQVAHVHSISVCSETIRLYRLENLRDCILWDNIAPFLPYKEAILIKYQTTSLSHINVYATSWRGVTTEETFSPSSAVYQTDTS